MTLRAVVETPRGSRHKFALDPELGAFVLKETLASGLSWPYDYGFIPKTLGADGDPLDILVLMDEPTFSGCVLTVQLLGCIGLTKDGVENDRYVGCLVPQAETSLSTDGYRTMSDLPDKLVAEIQQFLKEYSEEKGHLIELTGCKEGADALAGVIDGHEAFQREHGG
ncbi:MAG TPA: inorganic diphosphatase [Candidatus Elarobacter sp.]|nr:inorganic diphosphatase [Candidatus Elarobacter sp.]